MSRNRNKNKLREKKKLEKERLNAMRNPTPASKAVEYVIESNPEEKTKLKDSKGNEIPTEQERKSRQIHTDIEQVIDEIVNEEEGSSIKDNVSEYRIHNADRKLTNTLKHNLAKKDNASSVPAKVKIKKKYVLTDDARKYALKLGIILGVVLAVIIGTIITLNITEAHNKQSNNNPVAEQSVSLTGLTYKGKKLIDDIGKFDGFWENDDGLSYGELYNTLITSDKGSYLSSNGQYPKEGIFQDSSAQKSE